MRYFKNPVIGARINNADAALKYWMENGLYEYDYVILLLGDNEAANHRISEFFKSKLGGSGIIIDGSPAHLLLDLYTLYAFTDKLIIGSLDEPHGRKLRNLLDTGVATEEELIRDVILGAL